jgi:hypothetical protein
MKGVILSGFIILMLGTSCRKDFTCRCSKTYSNGTAPAVDNYSSYEYKEKRRKAETLCNANAGSGTDANGDYSIGCQIQ